MEELLKKIFSNDYLNSEDVDSFFIFKDIVFEFETKLLIY